MKKSLSLLTACILMSNCAYADNCKFRDAECYIANKVTQAYVSQDLAADSPATPLTSDEPILFNSIFTNAHPVFDLNKKTGTLILRKSGTYTVTFTNYIQGTVHMQQTVGVYATLNGDIIPTSSTYRTGGVFVTSFSETITFRAKSGDKFNIVYTFSSGSNFNVPVGPAAIVAPELPLSGPITEVDWSPNFYEIIYVGN